MWLAATARRALEHRANTGDVMATGYVVAADADLEEARALAAGFGLDVLDWAGADPLAALEGVENVGIVLSAAAAADTAYVTLLQRLADALRFAQLIATTQEARAAFAFFPEAWPTMLLEEARARADAMALSRGEQPAPRPQEPAPSEEEQPAAEPYQPAEPEAPPTQPTLPHEPELDGAIGGEQPRGDLDDVPRDESRVEDFSVEDEKPASEPPPDIELERGITVGGQPGAPEPSPETPQAPPHVSPPAEPPPPVVAPAPAPATVAPAPVETGTEDADRATPPAPPLRRQRADAKPNESAPADATAFAPKKLRRGTPELVRIVIHQPRDLADVIKAARKIDPRTTPAPSGMSIGEVALGASVGVSLEVRGAACDGTLQRRTWAGEPIDFSFSVEPDAEVKQAVILARVFVDDAQIGVIAFTRAVTGAAKAQPIGDKARMKRHKRVFLSYSSKDRETVSAIATAYQMAGVAHFWDRTSLKSGEEWHPRLRREIDRADLFHLCWSKSAATSEWVEKEAEYALTRRRRSNGKKPDITVQMLDGPPWAPHPPHLDSINFDDFVRAAIVGYARGDGGGD